MAENRTSVLRLRVHDHILSLLHDLSEENCSQLQETAYQCLLDGLVHRVVKRSHLQDRRFVKQLQGNSEDL